jgi:hypothetical protein
VRSRRAPTFLDHCLPDIQIDPKQDQRPEEDRKEGRADALQVLDAVEVVITTDEGANDHIDEREQAATEVHIPSLFHDLRAGQGTSAAIPVGIASPSSQRTTAATTIATPFAVQEGGVMFRLKPRQKENQLSTGAVIAIIVAALIVLVLLVLIVPRLRQRRLEQRRGEAGEHREEARMHGLRAEQEGAAAEEQAARGRREAAEAEERAQRAAGERGVAQEHEERARELDPDAEGRERRERE